MLPIDGFLYFRVMVGHVPEGFRTSRNDGHEERMYGQSLHHGLSPRVKPGVTEGRAGQTGPK